VLWSLDPGDFLIRIRIRPDCISTPKEEDGRAISASGSDARKCRRSRLPSGKNQRDCLLISYTNPTSGSFSAGFLFLPLSSQTHLPEAAVHFPEMEVERTEFFQFTFAKVLCHIGILLELFKKISIVPA